MAGALFDNFNTFQFHQDRVASSCGMCHSQNHHAVPATWILLDNQLTVNVFCNKDLVVTIICESTSRMNIHCNARVSTTNPIADLPNFGEVWYAPQVIANILSLSKLKQNYCVTYNSTGTNLFVVHKDTSKDRYFRESTTGLFYWNTEDSTSHLLVNTLETSTHPEHIREQLQQGNCKTSLVNHQLVRTLRL
jgi:hypothetical protein